MERAHETNTKWPWNHIEGMNCCWDIWPGKYAKTADCQHLLTFCEIQNAIPQWGSPRSSWFMSHFESVFRALFSCGIYIVNKQDSKNMFLRNFDFMVKSLHRIAVLEYLKSISSFEMAPTLYLIHMVSASFVPILRPLPFLAQCAIVLIDYVWLFDSQVHWAKNWCLQLTTIRLFS